MLVDEVLMLELMLELVMLALDDELKEEAVKLVKIGAELAVGCVDVVVSDVEGKAEGVELETVILVVLFCC